MPNVTLTYFDFSGSRGEECRLALHLAGVEFNDERLDRDQWLARKAQSPFGGLPIYSVEGHEPIGQSNTILRLIGRQHGLLPVDPWEAARHEALMDAVEDHRHQMGPITRIKDPEEKRRAREEAARGYLPEWAGQVDRHLGKVAGGPFVGGAKIGVADLKLYVVTDPYFRGVIDHVPVTVFDGAPRLVALHHAVADHPKVKEWNARKQ